MADVQVLCKSLQSNHTGPPIPLVMSRPRSHGGLDMGFRLPCCPWSPRKAGITHQTTVDIGCSDAHRKGKSPAGDRGSSLTTKLPQSESSCVIR